MGGIVWSSLYGTGAYLLGHQIEKLHGPLTIAFAVLGGLALIGGFLFIRSHEKRLEAKAEAAMPGPLDHHIEHHRTR